MRAILMLEHSDTVSGTTIFDDGTKAFWSEGRSSDVVILSADGKVRRVPASDNSDPIVRELNREQLADYTRCMNLAEEIEHTMARNFPETLRER